MIWLLPIWLCLLTALVGCGLLVTTLLARWGGPTLRGPFGAFQVFWLGYATSIVVLELHSLLFPIRWPVPALLAAMAAAGFWLQRRAVVSRVRSARARPRLTLSIALAALVLGLLIAAHAAQPVSWYDTHLYHLQVVKWARRYAAVPGVANLHYRLAYNNSIHLFGALVDVLWKGRAAHLAVGFLAWAVTLQLVCTLLGTYREAQRTRAGFCLLALPFVLGRVASNEIASLSSDLPLSLLCIVVVLELLGFRPEARRRHDTALALALALASVATTTKLGGLGVLAVSGACLLYSALRARSTKRTLALAALPGLVLAGYFARQSVLSGWLLFPAPIGDLHLPWSLPEAQTLDQFRWIQSWARIAGQEPAAVLDHGVLHWLEPWFGRFAGSQEFTLFACTCAAALYRLSLPKRLRSPFHPFAFAAAALSLVVWFRGAPDLRFGAGLFWTFFAVVGAPLIAAGLAQPAGRAFALALSLALAHWTGGLSAELPHSDYWTKLPPIERRATREVELSPGLVVRVPNAGPDDGEDRCSNEPLPCTPYPARQRLRQAGDLGRGFLY